HGIFFGAAIAGIVKSNCFAGPWKKWSNSEFGVQKMDRQPNERIVPEIAQIALIIAKGQTAETGAGDDEGTEYSFGGFGRFGFHNWGCKARGLPITTPFLALYSLKKEQMPRLSGWMPKTRAEGRNQEGWLNHLNG